MRKVLWRPTKITWQIHVIIALLALIGISAVEYFRVDKKQPYYKEKITAAKKMRSAMNAVRDYKIKNIGPLSMKYDPQQSGLIGLRDSVITSSKGIYEAKLTTINANWAAVLVYMYDRLNLKKGDLIAVSFSGSFPALNIAVLAAADTLGLKVLGISSLSASNWGANILDFNWLHMEELLYKKKIFTYRSLAYSLGGRNDRASKIQSKYRQLLRRQVSDSGIKLIDIENFRDNLDMRMEIYQTNAGDKSIAAYINVGGGIVSVGSEQAKKMYRPGINKSFRRKVLETDSLMSRFARSGLPLIHLSNVRRIAERYGLPIAPYRRASIGQGKLYIQSDYDRELAVLVLLALVTLLFFFIQTDVGHRIFTGQQRVDKGSSVEPMV